MNFRNTPFTIQLGCDAYFQFGNVVVEVGDSSATIQFGNVDFATVVSRAAPAPAQTTTVRGHYGRPRHDERDARQARRPVHPSTATSEASNKRPSIFERLSFREAPASKRIITGRQITTVSAPMHVPPASFSTGSFAPEKHVAEASSSGVKPSKRQRRKSNAALRAQGLLPEHPAAAEELEPLATIPTGNKFTNLRWVRSNSLTAELKQSFCEQKHQAQAPPQKKLVTLFATVHDVLKTVKNRGLTKRRAERPLVIRDEAPKRQSEPTPYGEHRAVTLGSLVQESGIERSRQKGKQVWRPAPHEERKGKKKDVSSSTRCWKFPFERLSCRWVPKEKTPVLNPTDGRHPDEFSRGSHHRKRKEKVHTFKEEEIGHDPESLVEEVAVPFEKPEIHWRRRSEVRSPNFDYDDEDLTKEDNVPSEICQTPLKKKNARKASASCLMVQHTQDYMQDLCFPNEDKPEHIVNSRLKQVRLGSDFESSSNTSNGEDSISEEEHSFRKFEVNKTAHIQLKCHKILPSSPKKKPSEKDKGKDILINEDIVPQWQRKTINKEVDYNVLSHLRRIPAQLSVYKALMMSKDLRETLIQALKDPEHYKAHFVERCLTEGMLARNEPVITFSEEDLLLGTTDHNLPLYVTAEYNDILMNRILIDPGSSVNLMNLRTLRCLSLDIHHLGRDKLMIQGFNEKGAQTLGSCVLPLRFGKFCTEAKFHIIDVDTSFKALLGRPWLHDYGIIPSTLHQCMKYIRNGEEFMIKSDIIPFAVHEVKIYQDAKYYFPKGPEAAKPPKTEASTLKAKRGSSREENKNFKGEKQATPILPRNSRTHSNLKRIILHLGSDTEEDEKVRTNSSCRRELSVKMEGEESHWGSYHESKCASDMQHIISERTSTLLMSKAKLGVTPIPPQHFKEITPRKVHVLKELKTFYVRPLPGGSCKAGSLFFSSEEQYNRASDGFAQSCESDELTPIRIPSYYSENMRRMMHMHGIPTTISKRQVKCFENLWGYNNLQTLKGRDQCTTRGLGFVEKKNPRDGNCYAIIDMEPKLDKEEVEELYEFVLLEEQGIEAKLAPEELEDGGHNATMDELKEINLGTEEHPRLTFINALLSEQKMEELKELLCEYRDSFAWADACYLVISYSLHLLTWLFLIPLSNACYLRI